MGRYIGLTDKENALLVFKDFCYIGIGDIGISRYVKTYIGFLSVSADKKIEFIGPYRYRPIRKIAYRSYTMRRCLFSIFLG